MTSPVTESMEARTAGPEAAAAPTATGVTARTGGNRSRSRRRRSLPLWWRLVLPLLVPALVLGVWQYVGSRDMLANGLFPSVTDSLEALSLWVFGEKGTDFYAGQWLSALVASIGRVLVGYVIGTALGIVLGLLAGVSQQVRRAFDPMINAIRPISVTAWVPMALILFGIGNKPAVFLTALATFFPIFVNTLSGARYSEGKLVDAAAMLGANRWQSLVRVTLPATLPSIAVSMRVAAAIAWTTVVVAEMLGAKSGLGYTLMLAYSQFRFDFVVAAMISVGLCGFLTDKILEHGLERRLKWVVGNAGADR